MANSPQQEKVMNAAADKFMQDLRVLLVESKPDERKAIGSFIDLLDKHSKLDTHESLSDPETCARS